MENYQRFAVYYVPPTGPFADFAARWLGWDAVTGRDMVHPDMDGLPLPVSDITATPRKYGFHGTIKPPFRLADGSSRARLESDLGRLAARLKPVECEALQLHRLGGFLALVPTGNTRDLAALAAEVVMGLDAHRRPAPPEELARRRARGLSADQESNLVEWGYPYVLDAFQFHLTLSGELDPEGAEKVAEVLEPAIMPLTPRPFSVSELTLCGAGDDGRFHVLHRYPLTG
ncbi:DUF1045 domain-containing protein [Celeribacter arenosi]|uniref:DUF1045 domain-containing protein n=1 Tax=Celeribacter arenosi TaxID=792649 RepID=A0ABP7K6N6_9RHOB